MTVTLGADVLSRYCRFTLYDSPYVAHDRGCAVDLYPEGSVAPSPIDGEVIGIRSVEAPPNPDARSEDYLVLVDTGTHVARLLHVEPQVRTGQTVSVGDPLGTLVRAGFFAPWVPNHIHLGFRKHEQDPYRASGSLRIELGIPVSGVPWDGTGTVVETGESWARLDSPGHPTPGEGFVGLASDGGVLDGGFPHYDGGGLLGEGDAATVAGTPVGTVSDRDVTWHDCTVRANGKPVTGIALFCGRDSFRVKLVGEAVDLQVGEDVAVTVDCKC